MSTNRNSCTRRSAGVTALFAVLLATAGCAQQPQTAEGDSLVAVLGQAADDSERQPQVSGTELSERIRAKPVRLSADDGRYLTWLSRSVEDEYCIIVSPSAEAKSVSASCVPESQVRTCGAWLSTVLPLREYRAADKARHLFDPRRLFGRQGRGSNKDVSECLCPEIGGLIWMRLLCRSSQRIRTATTFKSVKCATRPNPHTGAETGGMEGRLAAPFIPPPKGECQAREPGSGIPWYGHVGDWR